jgi:hypothetical protein
MEYNKKINQNVRMLCLYKRLLSNILPLNQAINLHVILITNGRFVLNCLGIPDEFIDEIMDPKKYIITKFLFPNKDGTGPVLIHNLYKAYKNATGKNYNEPDKIYIAQYSNGVSWEKCRLPTWKTKTYEIYLYNIKKLQEFCNNETNHFIPELFINHSEQIISIISEMNCSIASKEIYFRSILVYLQHFTEQSNNMDMHIFASYASARNKYADICMPMKEVPNYDLIILPKFKELMGKDIGYNLRRTILIFQNIGILRYSDLVWTKLNDAYDETCEYSQLCPDYWHISERYTKNGKYRKIKLPDLLYQEIKAIPNETDWLIQGESRENISITLAQDIKKHIGYNLNLLRGSIETYAIKNYTKEKSEELSYAMGHIFKTVMKYYYRET